MHKSKTVSKGGTAAESAGEEPSTAIGQEQCSADMAKMMMTMQQADREERRSAAAEARLHEEKLLEARRQAATEAMQLERDREEARRLERDQEAERRLRVEETQRAERELEESRRQEDRVAERTREEERRQADEERWMTILTASREATTRAQAEAAKQMETLRLESIADKQEEARCAAEREKKRAARDAPRLTPITDDGNIECF